MKHSTSAKAACGKLKYKLTINTLQCTKSKSLISVMANWSLFALPKEPKNTEERGGIQFV